MQKIPTIFVRSKKDPSRVTDECNNKCLWVFHGEGIATEKFDGTSIRVVCRSTRIGDALFSKRYDAKPGRTPPPGFEPCADEPDEGGHLPGWVPAPLSSPENKWLAEAVNAKTNLESGTYELVGPNIATRSGPNPHNLKNHLLWEHGSNVLEQPGHGVTLESIHSFLSAGYGEMEGIVWHHPDGRLAKVEARDLGIPWPRNRKSA